MTDPKAPPKSLASPFKILKPTELGSPYSCPGTTLQVNVEGTDTRFYRATITDFPSGGSIAGSDKITLNHVSPGLFSQPMPIGSVPATAPATPNKKIHVDERDVSGAVTDSKEENFIVWSGGPPSGPKCPT